MRTVYLNGEFVPETEAQVSIFDANGNLLGETQLKSGNMTPQESAGLPPQHAGHATD